MLAYIAGAAQVEYDPARQVWVLSSGTVEYRLRAEGGSVYLDYFGPQGRPPWPKSAPGREGPTLPFDISGQVEGQGLLPKDLELVSHAVTSPRAGVSVLRLEFRHRRLPLTVEAVYAAWGETGVFTRRLSVRNNGQEPLHLEALPSLALRLPPGEYELTYLWGGWGQERQVSTERLGPGQRTLASSCGRSTCLYSPWFALHNTTLGVRFAAQLAWSGNWRMSFERQPGRATAVPASRDLQATLGMQFDFDGALLLRPNEWCRLPEVAFTASAGDLDDVANQLHRYQRDYVMARTPANDPPLVQFNSWYPFQGKVTVADMKRAAAVAAELGAEVFVLDAGWYNRQDWIRELGDYEADRVAFPNGIEELSEYVRAKGMRFGIWVEIENIGTGSRMFQSHSDWCLAYNGRPVLFANRCQLNFARPEVRQWARAVVDRLVRDYKLGWIKIDYNIDIGSRFDPPAFDRPGDVLMNHLLSYYSWLDEVRAAYPDLVIENCSSGGLRFDLEMLRHTHTTWLSDVVEPRPSLQLAYGCTLEFAPEVCNHWMVGDKRDGSIDPKGPPGWWDFVLRIPMNGQYGISSRVADWPDELKKRAAENIALYKRLRKTIAGADVYHLTPPPDHNAPVGWMGLQYVSRDRARSVLMAYRLGRSEQQHTFSLRGLDETRIYRASIDGKPVRAAPGGELMSRGLALALDAEWRAAVVELEAQ